MPKTRAEFVNRCLVNLGILAEGQAASDEDVSKMDKMVDPVFSMLSGLDIYTVGDAGVEGPSDGNIEDAAFLPLADYAANQACAAFNMPADTKMMSLSMIAEGNLRTLVAPARTLRTLRVDPSLTPIRTGTYRW